AAEEEYADEGLVVVDGAGGGGESGVDEAQVPDGGGHAGDTEAGAAGFPHELAAVHFVFEALLVGVASHGVPRGWRGSELEVRGRGYFSVANWAEERTRLAAARARARLLAPAPVASELT